jgi:hypothetical protein
LPFQGFDEAHVFERHGLQFVDERFHLPRRLSRGRADVGDGVAYAGRITIEPNLGRRRGGLDHEQLLLHGVVQVARKAGALLDARRFANLRVVARAQAPEVRKVTCVNRHET